MKRNVRFQCLLHITLCSLSFGFVTLPVNAQTGDYQALEEIEARIEAIELELSQAQAERFRQRHELEYGNAELAKIRVEVKKREKTLLDLRQAYDTQVRATHAGVRESEKAIKSRFVEATKASEMADAINREINNLQASTNEADHARIPALQSEAASYSQLAQSNRAEALALTVKIKELKDSAAETDSEAKELKAKIAAAEKEYQLLLSKLNQAIDESPEIMEIDQKRTSLMVEHQNLQEKRQELQTRP